VGGQRGDKVAAGQGGGGGGGGGGEEGARGGRRSRAHASDEEGGSRGFKIRMPRQWGPRQGVSLEGSRVKAKPRALSV
jgi:hypothetical protein